jgi:hypothetical protein
MFAAPLAFVMSLALYLALGSTIEMLIQTPNPEMLFLTGESEGIPTYTAIASAISMTLTLPFGNFAYVGLREKELAPAYKSTISKSKLVISVSVVATLAALTPVGIIILAGQIGGSGGFALVLASLVIFVTLIPALLHGPDRNGGENHAE